MRPAKPSPKPCGNKRVSYADPWTPVFTGVTGVVGANAVATLESDFSLPRT
jgi:hypothetical protein